MYSLRLKTFLEIAAVFVVFALFGAWQVPDVNEAHYVCKAIHLWNPDWVQNDPFLQSKDSHWTFYLTFGWLTFFCTPTAMAWIGRIVAWSLLAWSWQRLSYALLPVRWAAIPTALALAYYIETFNMAGEWLIGGIEGKSLAYPFVFFALEAILRNRWNRAGVFLGIASAFHILVGGWTTLIAGGIFFVERKSHAQPKDCGSANFPWIGMIVGGLLALCGLIPVLMLNSGASAEVVSKAYQIYVFDRLPHHLVPYKIKESFLLRFALLTAIWILLCRHGGKRQRTFNAFVWGTLGLSAIGMILAYSISDKAFSAALLRFYWFRLADLAVPMGVAIGAVRWCVRVIPKTLTETQSKDFDSVVLYPTINRVFFGKCGLPLCRSFSLWERIRPLWGRVRVGATCPFLSSSPHPSPLPKGERGQEKQPLYGKVQYNGILTIIVTITAIYFSATYICFGYFKMSPPDQSIPWAITLLICFLFCRLYPSVHRPLSLWERARERAVCLFTSFPPHPNPLPQSGRGDIENAILRHGTVSLALFYIAIAIYAPLTALPKYADLRTHSGQSRTETVGPNGKRAGKEWQDMCQWIRKNTEPTAKFWVPRDGHTFKWDARRSDIGTWKNIPQDAESIVTWWRAMNDLYKYKNAEGVKAEDRLITTLVNSKTDEEIAELRQKYGFEYILCAQSYEMPTHAILNKEYENDVYCLYRVVR